MIIEFIMSVRWLGELIKRYILMHDKLACPMNEKMAGVVWHFCPIRRGCTRFRRGAGHGCFHPVAQDGRIRCVLADKKTRHQKTVAGLRTLNRMGTTEISGGGGAFSFWQRSA